MFTDEKDKVVDAYSVASDDANVYDLDEDDDGTEGDKIAADHAADGPEADQSDADSEPAPAKADTGKKAVQARNPKPYKGKERRTPSQKDVLSRLLEKNEVILQLTKKNVQLEAKVKELEDKRLRLAAEFENYRKRTRKEWELLKDQTKAEVLSEVLNVADDFERALAAMGGEEDDFAQGIRLIYNNLTSILEGFGIKKMDSLGELFDPNFHMAVATIESQDVKSNHIVEVIQEGYLMDNDVVRAAKVVIAK